jgi:hypothetical protein
LPAILLLVGLVVSLVRRPSGRAKLEVEFIERLNDCVWPADSVPTSDYPDDFVAYISTGNEYVAIENDAFTVKKPKRTRFCAIIHAADNNPDIAGMVILFVLLAAFCIFIVYQERKAQ